MCRILYSLNQSNSEYKIRRFFSHSKSLRTEFPVMDGYGLAGYNERTGKWAMYKSALSPDADPSSSTLAKRMSVHPLVIGHLRRQLPSNPAKPAIENSHPFYYKNRVFLHNGQIIGVHTPESRQWFLQNILPEYHSHIRGLTDTELMFYLFLTILQRKEQSSCDLPPPPLKKKELFERGCFNANKFDLLRDSIRELFHMLDAKFQMYIANIVYADKEYSIITHVMKNESAKDRRQNPMYLNHPVNNKGFLFSSEPISKNHEPVAMNTFYIVNHLTGEYQMHVI